MARASKKNFHQQASQSVVDGAETSSGSGKNKGTFSHKFEEKENVDPGCGGKTNGTSASPLDVVRVNQLHVLVEWKARVPSH